jgi:hypothetical protein
MITWWTEISLNLLLLSLRHISFTSVIFPIPSADKYLTVGMKGYLSWSIQLTNASKAFFPCFCYINKNLMLNQSMISQIFIKIWLSSFIVPSQLPLETTAGGVDCGSKETALSYIWEKIIKISMRVLVIIWANQATSWLKL